LKELEGAWPDRVITMQRNWIGKSIGARVRFAVADVAAIEPSRFSPRASTPSMAPARSSSLPPIVSAKATRRLAATKRKPSQSSRKCGRPPAKTEDMASAEKSGFFTGRYAINPFNNERLPIWVGNFVLMEYGTGAIMAVPATTSATSNSRQNTVYPNLSSL